MRSSADLSKLQLEIVKNLANGMTLVQIAKDMDRSASYIKQNANAARFKTNTRTLPQLVSIVIARGQLEWSAMEAGRVIQSHDGRANGDMAGT